MQNNLRFPAPPRLPSPPITYERQHQDMRDNALRLYFTQLSQSLQSVAGRWGGQYVDCPNALFFNTAAQTFAAINTAYPVVFNQTYLSSGVALASGSTSRVQADVNGVYNFQYTGQVISGNSSAKTIYIWIRRNGTDIGYSTRANTLSANGEYMEANWAFNIDLQAGDYIELMVSVSDTALTLAASASATPHPGIPSSVMTVNFIAPLPETLPTPPTP